MNQPPIDQLLSRVDSRYTAVVAAAKRARQLSEGAEPIETIESNKPVTIALYELGSGAIRYERIRKN
ncbi:MAG TPA: DNA-directed RNA polymerase subunit omega [Firmicutes bacterium]|nr:DNA-directed RNA polymerase subunit omega [Bacillota bacterium]